MKKISVIIPIYNSMLYLEKCINSVINQTYRNLEIILVDDFSSDRSGELCDIFEKKDSRIVVIHKPCNGGLSDARNCGLDIATGEYVSFVDSDDWIESKMYEKMIYLLEESNADIAICEFFRTNNYKDEIIPKKEEKKLFKSNLESLEAMFTKKLFKSHVCNKLFKISLFSNIFFPLGKLYEDQYITYQLLWKSKKVVYTNQQYYYYYCRESSIVTSSFTERKLDILDAYNQALTFFIKENVNFLEHIENEWVNIYISCSLDAIQSKKIKIPQFDIYQDQVKKFYKSYMRNSENSKKNKCVLFMLMNFRSFSLFFFRLYLTLKSNIGK